MLALILLATGFITASAHDGDPAPKEYARVTVTRTDDADMVHPQSKLKFNIIVERLGAHFISGATVAGPDGTNTDVDTDDITTAVQSSIMRAPYKTEDVEYTITSDDLGTGVASRTVTLDVDSYFRSLPTMLTVLAMSTPVITVKGTIDVDVTKRPDAGVGDSGVSIVFEVTEPDEIAKGKEVKFAFTTSTGDYGYRAVVETPTSAVVKKQLKDADGEKVGNALPVGGGFTLPVLQSNAVSDAVKTKPRGVQAAAERSGRPGRRRHAGVLL